jgi:mannose-6-phosphate isomerase-like protein (cupin superfamily)
MRTLITGVDDQGRSCLVHDGDIPTSPVPGIEGILNAVLYRTTQSPPPARTPGRGAHVDVQIPPGLMRVMVVEHQQHDGPTTATTMHSTDTLEFIFVVEGSADVVLDDGDHRVSAGDCVIMTGVDHAWRARPEGSRTFVVSVGTPPPTSEAVS